MRTLVTTLTLFLYFVASAASAATQFPTGEFPLTNYSKMSVSLTDILSGGPPKDGIPAIDDPHFIQYTDADQWLEESEPVVAFNLKGDARAYPIQILIYHEIVNDTVASKPVTVTFCPLCNASIVFDREVDGEVLDFGTTGRLRNSDLIMYDRQTESWWQQFTGTGIIGDYSEVKLTQLPSQLMAYGTFKQSYPEGSVLSRDTGVSRPYGQNPYKGYDRIDSYPFLFRGDLDPRLPPMERVLSIPDGEHTLLVPMSSLQGNPVINLKAANDPAVILATTEANSALDKTVIASSRMIPSAAAFLARVAGQDLTFEFVDGEVRDVQTASTWNAVGKAVNGKLIGEVLEPIDKGVHFAFAWLAFDPDARIYSSP